MLLVHAPGSSRSRYSHYLAELLRLEGFSAFAEIDIERLTDEALAGQEIVILPRLDLTVGQADLLVEYLTGGGKLVALHPDPFFGQRLGAAPAFQSISDGYLWIDRDQPVTSGLCAEPVQIVVPSVRWQFGEGASIEVLAEIRSGRDPVEVAAGVIRLGVGNGEAILFAYDLPHAVARLRQGDPDYADVSSAGLDNIYRPHELFVNQLPYRQLTLPQADVHTSLLARVIETLAPQPRIWYYPEAGQRSVMVMTSDDDWSTIDQFEQFLESLQAREGTCTFYVVPGTHLTDELMTEWERAGHTFSVHPARPSDYSGNPAKPGPQSQFVPEMIRDNVIRHQEQFGRPVRTIRQHAIRWVGYVDVARLLAELGVRLECNYVSVPPLTLGYLCGSGHALPFVDLDGTVIPCYQLPTFWTEEALINPKHKGGVHWLANRAIAETTEVIRRAAREFYGPITFNSHPVSFATYSRPLVEADWDAARAEGMPIVSADRWLDWTEARRGLRITTDADRCTLRAAADLPAATVLFPEGWSLAADGAERSSQILWGRRYEAVTVRQLAAGDERRIKYERRRASVGAAR